MKFTLMYLITLKIFTFLSSNDTLAMHRKFYFQSYKFGNQEDIEVTEGSV